MAKQYEVDDETGELLETVLQFAQRLVDLQYDDDTADGDYTNVVPMALAKEKKFGRAVVASSCKRIGGNRGEANARTLVRSIWLRENSNVADNDSMDPVVSNAVSEASSRGVETTPPKPAHAHCHGRTNEWRGEPY